MRRIISFLWTESVWTDYCFLITEAAAFMATGSGREESRSNAINSYPAGAVAEASALIVYSCICQI